MISGCLSNIHPTNTIYTMSDLTADQLNAIASSLLAVADAINDYLDSPPVALTVAQRSSLEDLLDKLDDEVDAIAAKALTIALDDAANAVAKLTEITKDIDADIAHLTNVEKIINVAGSAVNLAVAIIGFETNPGALPGAVSALVDSIGALTKPAGE